MRASMLPLCLIATGCAISEQNFAERYSATGVRLLQADVEAGDLDYRGGTSVDFVVDGRSWGLAFKEEGATEQRDGNSYAAGVQGQALVVQASSERSNAGVDFTIDGPEYLDTDIELRDGDIALSRLIGVHALTADDIDLDEVVGSVDAYASGRLDAHLLPSPGDTLRLETNGGDLSLSLPYGLEYDLQVWGDLDHEMIVDDLGLQQVMTGEAYFAGVRGRGTIRVDVFATGGSVRIDARY